MKYLTICHQYADDILSEKIRSGKLIKLACKRFKDDILAKKWIFDDKRAEKFIEYAESYQHWEGSFLKNPIRLEPHQIFYMAQLFGWRDDDGIRRFRNVYKQVARKNGKTIEGALIGLFCLDKSGEGAPQVIVVANREEQAGICVNSAGRLVMLMGRGYEGYIRGKSEKPFKLFEYRGRVMRLVHSRNNGVMMTLGKDATRQDGFNPYVAIVDEYHEAVDDSMINVLRTGMGSRREPIVNVITTAGFNKGGVCYSMRKYCMDVLSGVIEDDSMLALIYELDPEMDWRDPENWICANPNLDVSVFSSYLKQELKIAETRGGTTEVSFKTKNLNMWTNSYLNWIPDEIILECDQRELRIEDFNGRDVWCGLDLAKTRDLNALAMVSPDPKTGVLDVLWKFYLPADRARDHADGVDYLAWAQKGFITLTPGNIADHEYIANDIIKLLDSGANVKALDYDRYLAESNGVIHKVLDTGFAQVRPVAQTIGVLSTPTKATETMIFKKQMNFNNPVARWNFANVIIVTDANGNVRVDKKKSANKIDGISALVNAMVGYLEDTTVRTTEIDDEVYPI